MARPASGFPTVHGVFTRWSRDGVLDQIRDTLWERIRQRAGRQAQPSVAAIDAQSVRAAETVDASTRGYGGGNKVSGRKRHIAVDTMGLLLVVMVTAASLQDRPVRRLLLRRLHRAHHRVRLVGADGGYTDTLLNWAKTTVNSTIEIVN